MATKKWPFSSLYHFYVNKLGLHIVAYYNKHYKDAPEDMWEMYKFRKIIK